MSNEKKHYIVSYKTETVTTRNAASILNVKKVEDGLELLSSSRVPEEADILHFEDLGSSVLSLSEAEAKKLEKNKDVLEVIEDFEVFALGCSGDMEMGDSDENPYDAMEEDEFDYYSAGYQQAMDDMQAAGARPGFAPSPPGFNPTPPVPPTPPPSRGGCPPGTRPVVRCEPIPIPPPPPPPPVVVRQPIPWNISMVKANDVWRRVKGNGVKVAILDTGIDEDHPDLTVSGGKSFVPGELSWNDVQSHGTHCAGIVGARHNARGVVGVAPECDLYAGKVLSNSGSGRFSWILAGMEWARKQGMDVVSMSLGSNARQDNDRCNTAYQRAAQKLIDSGCIVIAAAGNAGRTSTWWVGHPARCPGFMAVAAVDQRKRKASFSSWGPPFLGPQRGIEISAPGVSINSTVPGGGYGKKSGTSMACPHVSGAAALLKQLHPTWTPEKIRKRLNDTADDLGVPGDDPKYGNGLLNCHRAVFG